MQYSHLRVGNMQGEGGEGGVFLHIQNHEKIESHLDVGTLFAWDTILPGFDQQPINFQIKKGHVHNPRETTTEA